MEGKKKYFVIIILLLFLSFTIYTFANPKREDLYQKEGKDGYDYETEEVETEEGDEESTEEETNTMLPADGGNLVVRNQVVRDNTKEREDAARKLVEQAESTYKETDYNPAKGAVNNLPNGSTKEELSERLNSVEEGLNLQKQVKELKEKVSSSTTSTEMDTAREYNSKKDLSNKVKNFNGNKEVKEEMQEEMNMMEKVLEDTDAPKVSMNKKGSISEGDYVFANSGSLTVEDETNVTVTLTDKKKTKQSLEEPYELPKDEGVYEIEVEDEAHNVMTFTLEVDETSPKFDHLEEGTLAPSVSLGVTDENFAYILIEELDDEGNVKRSWKESRYWTSFGGKDYEGSWRVTAYDEAGNHSDPYTFTIDATPAKVSAANILVDGDKNEQKEFYATNGDTIYTYITVNEKLGKLPKFVLMNNGKEYPLTTKETGPESNGNYVYRAYYKVEKDKRMVDGEIQMKVTGIVDQAGNTSADVLKPTNSHVVYLDTKAPKIVLDKLLENNLTNDKDLTITDANNFTSKIEKAGKTVKENIESDKQEDGTYYDRYGVFSGDGEYTVSATDAAGNTSSVTFIYDSTKPTGEVAVQKKDNTDSKTAKRGDWLVFTVTFDEALSTTPTLTVGGNTGNVVKVDGNTYTYEVNLPAGLPDGKVPFTVSNIVDLAGNKADDITAVTEGYWIEVDNTPIKLNAKDARVYGTNNNSNNTLAKMGDRIQVVLDVQEELTTMPTLVINGEKIEFVPTAGTEGSHHVYEANYTVKDGEDDAIVEYQIINLQDEAGNGLEGVEGTTITNESFNEMKYDFTTPQLKGVPGSKHTNKDVTVTVEDVNPYTLTAKNRDNKETYTSADGKTLTLTEEGLYDITATDKAGNSSDKVQMRMDKTPITVNFFHAYAIGENNTSGDTLAKAKDTIQVVLHTKEKLAKLPELWIDGEKVGNFRHVEDQDTNDNKVYAASYYIREASPEKDNQMIHYEVKGLTDQSGNGVTYKEAKDKQTLTYENANTIRYDFTLPKVNVSDLKDGYTNNGRFGASDLNLEKIVLYRNGKIRKTYKEDITTDKETKMRKRNCGLWEGEGVYKVEAYDKAGNQASIEYTYDTTPVRTNVLEARVEGTNNKSNNTLAKVGDKFIIVLDVGEELTTMPTLVINEEEAKFHETAGWTTGHYVYAASIFIKDNVLEKDGKVVDYQIKNLTDQAGNGIDKAKKTDSKGNTTYPTTITNALVNEVVYDFTVPKIGVTGLVDGLTNSTKFSAKDRNLYNFFLYKDGKQIKEYNRNFSNTKFAYDEKTGMYSRSNGLWTGTGNYKVVAYDEAGNESVLEYRYEEA